MKTLGNRSLSSVIKIIIYAGWYIQLFLLGLATVFLTYIFITEDNIQSDITVRLTQSQPLAVAPSATATSIRNATLELNAGKLHFTQDKTWGSVFFP